MQFIQLIPALVLNLGGGHAVLHPADTNLYIEVPNISEVIPAYENAPFAQFFRDPAIQEFAANFIDQDPEEIGFTSLLDAIIEEVRADLPAAGLQILELIPEVDHLSISLSGIEFEGLTDEILESEGVWSDKLDQRIGNLRAQFVMDFASAEAAQRSAQVIRDQMGEAGSNSAASMVIETQFSFAGEELEWTVMRAKDGDFGISFWFATSGPRLICGMGFVTDLEAIALSRGSLADSGDFAAASKHFTNTQGVRVMDSYFRLDGMGEMPSLLSLIPGVDSQLSSSLGYLLEVLMPGGRVESSSQVRLVGSRFITETFERDFSAAGSPRFSSDEAVTRDSFNMVPAEAVGVWATNLDKEGMSRIFMEWLTEFSGQEPTELLARLEEQYGFRPDRDLIDALGGEFVFYNLPFTGVGLPKMYIALELNDATAFVRGLEGLGQYLTEEGEGSVEFNSRAYRKNPFMTFAPGKDLDEMVDGADWAPAFVSLLLAVGVVEDRAILSFSSMYTKREMKRMLKSAEDSEHALFASADEIPTGVINYGTTNYAEILAGVYDSIRGFLPLISQGGGVELPFEIDDMPSSDLFAKYFAASRSWGRRVEGGTYTYNESSFGPEVAMMFSAAAGAALLTFQSEAKEMEASIQAVPDEHYHETAASVTQDRMGDLKLAIVVYKGDIGRHPGALIDLLVPSTNFPSGYLDRSELPKDGWGRSFRYRAFPERSQFQIWSTGADGVDEEGAGDDLVLRN